MSSRPQPTRRLNGEIPEQLHKDVKIAAVKEDKSMTKVMIEALREWLAARG